MQPPGPFTQGQRVEVERLLVHGLTVRSALQFKTFSSGSVAFSGSSITFNTAGAVAWFTPGGQLWPQ